MLTAAAVGALAGATAEGGASSVLTSNWYFDDPGQSASAAGMAQTPSMVPTGDFGVGYRNGATSPVAIPATVQPSEADKITALNFTMTGIAAKSTISAFTFSTPVDITDANSETEVTAAPPALVACLATRRFTPGTGPTNYEQLPDYTCVGGNKIPGVFNTTTMAYDFSAPVLAQEWTDDVNTGLVILPDPATANPTTFTISLKGPASITAKIAAVAPPASPSPMVTPPVSVSPLPTTSPKPTATKKPAPVKTVAPVAAVPPPAAVVPMAVVPAAVPIAAAPVTVATTASAAAPVVAATTPPAGPSSETAAPVVASTPVASSKKLSVSGGLSPVVYVLAVLLLLGALGAVSVGLSNHDPVTADAGQPSRLSRMLSGRSDAP